MKHIFCYIFILSVSIVTFSCTDEGVVDTPPTSEEAKVNEWLYKKMADEYLWYKEIPDKDQVKFSFEPKSFFYSLLSKEDGKDNNGQHYYYSYIESKTGTRSYLGDQLSCGFEYQPWNLGDYLGLQVLYVLPNTPADGILKRGDWILSINGKPIDENYDELLTGSANVKLGVASTYKGETRTIDIIPTTVVDNPVYSYKIFPGTNIGYLAYNHFTNGPNNTSEFDNSLKNALSELKGVSDFILDLRYNGGGYVSCAQILASYLLPKSQLDNVFCKMTYNDRQINKNTNYKFIKEANHPDFNLDRLFIIISPLTASASELVIASLLPYLGNKIILVGDTSEGKNVGSVEWNESGYGWIVHPIVCRVTNSEELDYVNGFSPNSAFKYRLQDDLSLGTLYDLGDPREEVVSRIIKYVNTGKQFSERSIQQSRSSSEFQPIYKTPNRKKTGIIIN